MTELELLLNSILEDEELDCVVKVGKEFAYYYANGLIVVDPTDTDTKFLAFARRNGLDERVGNFVISFFHEVGHNETIDEVEEEYDGDKNVLSEEEYYSLEEEWVATEWAIDFCNSHIELVEKIQKKL